MKYLGALFIVLTACHTDMQDQPRYEPLEPSTFFRDGRSARALIPGTVYRGQLEAEEVARTPPAIVDKTQLLRGAERYDIYCSPCHDRAGSGRGVIVLRGMKQPPTFHQDRLRNATDEYLFQVITKGFGAMYPYGSRIPPEDRWSIVSYVRALQLSQNARAADLPEAMRAKLEAVK